MIVLHSRTGEQFAVNCELIERIDANPDTLLTMSTGKKFLVSETLPEVLALLDEHHSTILTNALTSAAAGTHTPHLRPAPAEDQH